MAAKRSRRIVPGLIVSAALTLACGLSIDLGGAQPAAPAPAQTATFAPAAPRPTTTPNSSATQASQMMADRVQQYYEAGYIDSTEGTYLHLDDYISSWSQTDRFSVIPVGLELSDFVLSARLAWESASDYPDGRSGCGFVFRLQRDGGSYMVVWGVDGRVYSLSEANGLPEWLGNALYGIERPNGEAEVVLIVSGSEYRVGESGRMIRLFQGYEDRLLTGQFAYAIVPGSAQGFGTRCAFTALEIWALGGAVWTSPGQEG